MRICDFECVVIPKPWIQIGALAVYMILQGLPMPGHAASETAGEALRDGLVLHFPFNEGAGTNAVDLSGNGIHGVIHAAEWVKDTLRGEGYVLKFNDASCVTAPHHDLLSIEDAITVSVWMYLNEYGSYYAKHIAQKWRFEDAKNVNYVMYFFGNHNAARPAMEGTLALHASRPDENMKEITHRHQLDVGHWRHVAAVYHKDEGGRLYVDGVPTMPRPTSFRGKLAVNNADFKMTFGDGMLSDLRIYNRALSAPEIVDIIKAGVKGVAFILDAPLNTKPSDAIVSGNAENMRVVPGRVKDRNALCMNDCGLQWNVAADGACFIECWIKPVGWDMSAENDIEVAWFKAGGKDYRLCKPGGESRLTLAQGKEILWIYPIYNWFNQEWMKGVHEREQWHYLNIALNEHRVNLFVDGFTAHAAEVEASVGDLEAIGLVGSAGTAFSELRIVPGGLANDGLRMRYMRLYRGDDAALLR